MIMLLARPSWTSRSWRLISNVSLGTSAGLLALVVAALFGAAAALGTLWLAAGSNQAQLLATYIFPSCSSLFRPPFPEEAPFLAENQSAMTTMMVGMEIHPTGNVDRDFVDMMVPHHQGAIDMAMAVLRYGHNQQIRRLAQEIIVTQQQEITAMRLAVDEPLPPPIASPTSPGLANGH
jgi:hypothetical protein